MLWNSFVIIPTHSDGLFRAIFLRVGLSGATRKFGLKKENSWLLNGPFLNLRLIWIIIIIFHIVLVQRTKNERQKINPSQDVQRISRAIFFSRRLVTVTNCHIRRNTRRFYTQVATKSVISDRWWFFSGAGRHTKRLLAIQAISSANLIGVKDICGFQIARRGNQINDFNSSLNEWICCDERIKYFLFT